MSPIEGLNASMFPPLPSPHVFTVVQVKFDLIKSRTNYFCLNLGRLFAKIQGTSLNDWRVSSAVWFGHRFGIWVKWFCGMLFLLHWVRYETMRWTQQATLENTQNWFQFSIRQIRKSSLAVSKPVSMSWSRIDLEVENPSLAVVK